MGLLIAWNLKPCKYFVCLIPCQIFMVCWGISVCHAATFLIDVVTRRMFLV